PHIRRPSAGDVSVLHRVGAVHVSGPGRRLRRGRRHDHRRCREARAFAHQAGGPEPGRRHHRGETVMYRGRWAALAVAALAALAAGCGKTAPATTSTTTAAKPAVSLPTTTPAAKGETGPVTWATYREVGTLDPIQAFDYPENTVITSLCDSLLQQQADGTSKPGLATKVETPDPLTLVVTSNTDAKLWDGK